MWLSLQGTEQKEEDVKAMFYGGLQPGFGKSLSL